MAISMKKPGTTKPAEPVQDEQAAQKFIAGANKAVTPPLPAPVEEPAKPKPSKKVGIMVYFDPNVLEKVDAQAKKQGLSRSAWLHSTAIKALPED